jgi:catechol 2,3-dioxygenase-like lactoylglutathione lyase family enzyme
MMITSFDHVAITVKNFDATINWYLTKLGFTVNRIIENTDRGIRIAFLEAGGHAMLEFFGFINPDQTMEGPTLRAEETGIKHISFFVEDLDATCRRLQAAGIEFTTLTQTRAVFHDPNGTALELRQQ